MEKIRFGRTNLMVSRVAFGGIPVMRLSKEDGVRLVQDVVRLGVNFIDTAHGYSDSEEKIGHAVKTLDRARLVIASKSPANDKKTFNEHLDLSLKRLQLDCIDIYQLHHVSTRARIDAVFAPGGAMEGLMDAVKAGKVRFPAFSSHSVPVAMDLMRTGKFASVQLPLNYLDDAAEKAVSLAAELDMGFIAMKPMGGGLLSDAGLSFRYLMQFGGVVPDPGIEKLDEMKEIIGVIKKKQPLTDADKAAIEAKRVELGATWCHRCDYCQPCPQGILISMVLSAKSSLKRFTPERARDMVGTAVDKARTCTGCGACMKRCPYNLEIPKLLKDSIAHWDSVMR